MRIDSSRSSLAYDQAVAYLESFVHYERMPPREKNACTFDLEGFRRFLGWLGNPQERLRVVHVAGTKGKGSTCAMIASILTSCGYRVGLYTSPHLVSYRERIQIDGEWITAKRFVRQVHKVKDAMERYHPRRAGEFRTAFEILTAAAFLEFVDQGVDFAVVEAGLGGSLDATNVVHPAVAVFTTVSLDHTRILGKTVGKIAKDKGGIIKSGCVAVVGPQPRSSKMVLLGRCREQGVPIRVLGKDYVLSGVRTDLRGTQWDLARISHHPSSRNGGDARNCKAGAPFPVGWVPGIRGVLEQYVEDSDRSPTQQVRAYLPLQQKGDEKCGLVSQSSARCYERLWCPLPGRHQAENGSLAVMAVEALSEKTGHLLREAAIRKGLEQVRWSGRFQALQPGVILDGAHNVDSAKRLVESFREIFPGKKAVLVLGISRGKDVQGILKELTPITKAIVTTQAHSDRAIPARELARSAKELSLQVCCFPDPLEALKRAKKLAAMGEPVLVTGSLFLVGDVLRKFGDSIRNSLIPPPPYPPLQGGREKRNG